MSTITIQSQSKYTIPSQPLPPILVLSPNNLNFDPDPQSLYSLWTIFSKCKNSIENGRRLENMSWRIWNREHLYNDDLISNLKNQNHHHISSEELQTLFQFVSTENNNIASIDGEVTPKVKANHDTIPIADNINLINSTKNLIKAMSPEKMKQSNVPNNILPAVRVATPRSITPSITPSIGGSTSTGVSANRTNHGDIPNLRTPSFTSSITPTPDSQNIVVPSAPLPPTHTPSLTPTPTPTPTSTTGTSSTNTTSIQSSNVPTLTSTPAIPNIPSNQQPSARTVSSLFSKTTRPSSRPASSTSSIASNRPITELPLPVSKPNNNSSTSSFFRRKSSSSQSNPLHSKIAQQRKIAAAAMVAGTSGGPSLSSSDHSQAITDDDDSSDTLSDENESDTESDSDDDERLSHHHRSATSTSIVRGFSPSNISISVVNRTPSQRKISPIDQGGRRKSSSSKETVPSNWKPTKARPDRLPREKMFFIESSPSDSEFGGESLSSSEGVGTPSAPPKAYNLGDVIGNQPEGQQQQQQQPQSQSQPQPPQPPQPQPPQPPSSVHSTHSSHSNHPHSHLHHRKNSTSPTPSIPSKLANPPTLQREDRKRSSLFTHTKSQPALSRLASKTTLPTTKSNVNKGQTTKNMIMNEEQKKMHEKAILTDEEDEDDDDDDIHDDDEEDDSAWDSVDDESDSSFDEESFFVREEDVPKRPLIRPSLLSSLFLNKQELLQEQLDNSKKNENITNKITTTPSTAPTSSASGLSSRLKTTSTTAVPINTTDSILNATVATHIPPPGALSPRTTRRNMLSTELSESLRKNLLWERQQNGGPAIGLNGISSMVTSNEASGATSPSNNPTTSTTTTNNVLRRSHTSTGVMTLNKAPPNVETWKEEMDEHNLDFNYHARGW